MAITITDQPTNFAKVGQKLMIVATSTNVAQPNFRYVVRIYNTYTSELMNEMIVPPNPQNRLMYDIQPVVNHELTQNGYVLSSSGENLIVNQTQAWLGSEVYTNSFRYNVNILEAYDVGGVFTINEGSATPMANAYNNNFVVVNGHYTLGDGYKPNPNTTYSLTSTTSLLMGSRKPNTNYPSTLNGATPSSQRVFIPVRKSELDWGCINYIMQGGVANLLTTTNEAVARMTLYESDGTPNTANVTPLTTDDYPEICYLQAYPANLNAHGLLLRPADFPNWRWYEIAIYDSTNTTRKSAAYTFYPVDDDCTYDNIRLAWWDDVVGGFDFFNFQRKNEITMEVERKRVKPVVGTYDAATFSFNTFDGEIKEGMIDAVDYLEVTSGWIQEGEFELLKHLVKSKMVYIVNDNGTLTPVVMETNSFLVNKERNAKLKSVSFRLRIAQQNIQ